MADPLYDFELAAAVEPIRDILEDYRNSVYDELGRPINKKRDFLAGLLGGELELHAIHEAVGNYTKDHPRSFERGYMGSPVNEALIVGIALGMVLQGRD